MVDGLRADRGLRLETAIAWHGAGRHDEAERAYRALLAEQPNDADVLHLLGVLAHQRGRGGEGRELIAAAIALDAAKPLFHNNLALIFLDQGAVAEAAASAGRALALVADYPEALVTLGTAHLRLGRLEEAGENYRAALRLRPDDAEGWLLFGNLLVQQGRTDQALEVYRHAHTLQPRRADILVQLGNALKLTGDRTQAASCYRKALEVDPTHGPALNNLGNLLQAGGAFGEAEALYRRVLAAMPDHPGALGNLGSVLQAQARFDEAMACYRRALEIAPDAAACHNLATALKRQNRLGEAVTEYRRALALAPDYPEALSGLGAALQAQGHVAEAVPLYERALTLRPDFHEPLNHLMFALNALPDVSSADLLRAARRWTAAWPAAPAEPKSQASPSDPDRPLRIGYVSPDFRHHPVGYFLTAVLEHHDPATVEIHCYSNSPITDDITRRIRAASRGWHEIGGLDDAAAAELVRADGIDILVDLSGHMADHRLPLFQRRPAPVQATWLGFFCSTGLDAIDHIIADPTIIPAGDETFYRERVWRLPGCYLCFDGGTIDLPVAPVPAGETGPVTFGCLNRRDKMSAPALAAWAEILRRVPDGRLLLKTASFSDPVTREEMIAAFARHGIAADRLIIEGATARQAHLSAYQRIDIALDPFPYTGATTSAETLWMGVPLVTLRGRTFVGRVSASMLDAVGLAELVAETVEDYVERAVALAADRPRLADLRRGLRAATRRGLGDGASFARALEALYRGQWREWCSGREWCRGQEAPERRN